MTELQDGLLKLEEVLKATCMAESTWWAGVKTGKFPKPVKLGARTSRWKISEINSLIESGSE